MSSQDRPTLKLPVGERDHIEGSPDAKVTLLEYGDYQCPYCGEAYPILKQIQKRFGSELRFVFRNFPITESHPMAEFGAELAEASGAQGKFWEMHDYIYEHQSGLLSQNFFFNFAKSTLRLNESRMMREVSSHAYEPRIREDFMSGVRSGVNGTPTFFVDGLRHNGDYQYDTLVEAVETVLRGSKEKEPSKKMAKKSAKKVGAPK